MFVRLTTVTGATDIDGGIAFLRDKVVPQIEQQKGYRGITASADRAAGVVAILTLWAERADLDASESVADKQRAESLAVLGGKPAVERFEQTVAEVGPVPPGPGSTLQVRRVTIDRARLQENLDAFRTLVVPEMKAAPGFQAVRQFVDRATGAGLVGTVWADQASLEAASASSEQSRQEATGRGVEFGEVSVREVIFSAIR